MATAKVLQFGTADAAKCRKRALSNPAALKYLRNVNDGAAITVVSYGQLASLLGWEQSRTFKAVQRWVKDGRAVIETNASGALTSIRATPTRTKLVRGKGTGVQRDRTKVSRTRNPGVLPTANTTVPSTDTPMVSAAQHNTDIVENKQAGGVTYGNEVKSERAPAGAPQHGPVEAPQKASADLLPDYKSTTARRDVERAIERPFWRRRGGGGGTPPALPPAPARPRVRRSFGLTLLAYGFCALGVAINISSNRTATGDWLDYSIPIALGILAELAVFLIPSRLVVMPPVRRVVGVGVLALVVTFAAMNSLRNASHTLADQTLGRTDRVTAGISHADGRLDAARLERDRACRTRARSRSEACKAAEADVAKLEGAASAVAGRVTTAAKSEDADFAKLVTFVSAGRVQPSADTFSTMWLLFRTILPLLGGVLLALARRA